MNLRCSLCYEFLAEGENALVQGKSIRLCTACQKRLRVGIGAEEKKPMHHDKSRFYKYGGGKGKKKKKKK